MNYPPPPPPPPAPPKRRINSRSKGQRGERQIIDMLQPLVDEARSRYSLEPVLLQRNMMQAHLGGEDVHGLDGVCIEVKRCETLQVKKWWEQTLRQAAAKDAIPVLLYRRNKEPWTAMLRLFVETQAGSHQIEMDVTVNEADFTEWFKAQLDELCVTEVSKLK